MKESSVVIFSAMMRRYTEKVAEPQPVYKVRTTKNVSIKTVAKTASWRLESKDDVDKYLAALRENLLKEMDEDTIVNIEL